MRKNVKTLESRAVAAAEATLAERRSVSAIDVRQQPWRVLWDGCRGRDWMNAGKDAFNIWKEASKPTQTGTTNGC